MQRALWATFLLIVVGCGSPVATPELHGPQALVVLHTADTHSQLFPWPLLVGSADARRGLGVSGELTNVGGFARLATVLHSERAHASRTLHLDAGDLFQGSLTFERFGGEPEVLGFDALGVDAQTLGNHELDRGVALVHERYQTLARFPLLAANYLDDGAGGLSDLIEPFVVLDAEGLRVGVVGVGNTSSVALLASRPNELVELAQDASAAVQGAVDLLRPVVDFVVVVTHVGLDADEALVRSTSGIDLVLGGHQHLTLDAPDWLEDCGGGSSEPRVLDAWGHERRCTPRRVPIVHSGAYGKFVGRLALHLDDDAAALGPAYDPLDRYEIVGLDFELVPVGADTPEDPAVAELLAPYQPGAADPFSPASLVGYAPELVERYGATGGDSALGNLAAEAARSAAEADLAILGASSLRHDLPPGPLDLAGLVEVVPFEDPIVRAELSGGTLAAAFEGAARSASGRDCRTQVQVSGVLARFRCPCMTASCARIFTPETAVTCVTDDDCSAFGGACNGRDGRAGSCFAPLDPSAMYRVATTEYVADGGSGLLTPIPETARLRESDSLNAAISEFLRGGPGCAVPTDCASGCPAALMLRQHEECTADGLGDDCSNFANACERALDACRYLPCIDAGRDATRDGRIQFEAP